MKTTWTLQDKPNRYDLLSEDDIKKIVGNIQDDMDREIIDRYTWDWEFRQSVDRIMDNPPHVPWIDNMSGRAKMAAMVGIEPDTLDGSKPSVLNHYTT